VLFEVETAPLVTSDYVLDETVTTLKARAGHLAGVSAGEAMLNSSRLSIEPVSHADWILAWQIFRDYGDKLWSFTDCTSKALIDRLSCAEVWSIDADFRQMGYVVRP
jgi:predicted nucleic acid-binding protein